MNNQSISGQNQTSKFALMIGTKWKDVDQRRKIQKDFP